MTELFSGDLVKRDSPRREWMRLYHIELYEPGTLTFADQPMRYAHDKFWLARQPGILGKTAFGETDNEALQNLAAELNIPTWH